MSKKIMIIGAGGHGRVCAEIAQLCGYEVDFLDDASRKDMNIVGETKDFFKYIDSFHQ